MTNKIKPIKKAFAVIDTGFNPNIRTCQPTGDSTPLIYSTTFYRIFPTLRDAKTWKLLDSDSIVEVKISPISNPRKEKK